MAGFSEARNCSRCGAKGTLEHNEAEGEVQGMCVVCGYHYHSIFRYGVYSLDEVNAEREVYEMVPITELSQPLPTWRDHVLNEVKNTIEVGRDGSEMAKVDHPMHQDYQDALATVLDFVDEMRSSNKGTIR